MEGGALSAPDEVGGVCARVDGRGAHSRPRTKLVGGDIRVGGRGRAQEGWLLFCLGLGGGGVAALHGGGAGGVGVAFVSLMLGGGMRCCRGGMVLVEERLLPRTSGIGGGGGGREGARGRTGEEDEEERDRRERRRRREEEEEERERRQLRALVVS